MKYLTLNSFFLLIYVTDTLAQALPPEHVKDKWDNLERKGFSDWVIKGYEWKGAAGDGGSIGYTFTLSQGLEFDIIAASSAYWSEIEKRDRVQVFYVVHDGKFYKVVKEGKHEEKLLQMLKAALASVKDVSEESSIHLKKLISHIQSRKPFREPNSEKKE